MDEPTPTQSTTGTNNIEDAPRPTHEDEQAELEIKEEAKDESFEPDWNAFVQNFAALHTAKD
eukprot:11062106-Prorocentrum_lima.AAC.1